MTEKSVALITGTSRGIGQYLAGYYLEKGYSVIGCSRSDSTITNSEYHHFKADVAKEADIKAVFRFILKEFGKLDVLINNAGTALTNHITLFPAEKANEIIQTNFTGTFLFIREASKIMMKKKAGRIINIASVDTPMKLEGTAVYAASKAAVVSLTEITAKELAPYNITVNAVGPAPVKTELVKDVSSEKFDKMLQKQAIQRYCEFEDISNVTDFFIRKESNFVTGQCIYLGGV